MDTNIRLRIPPILKPPAQADLPKPAQAPQPITNNQPKETK